MTELHADGYFAILPEWVLFASIGPNALKLYGILSLHCDYATRECKLGRKALAHMLGDVSLDTVDRAKAELVKLRALEIRKVPGVNGGHDHNVYFVRRSHPDLTLAAPGAATPAATLAAPAAAHEQEEELQIQETLPISGLPPGYPVASVAKVDVTRAEALLSLEVLATFNELAGTNFRSKDFLGSIVLRLREHPELALSEHRAIIERTLKNPWWKGSAAPNVVYGNGSTFERALNGEGKQDNGKPGAEFGRGFDRFDV